MDGKHVEERRTEMKARIRGTNIEVDVQPFYDETGYFAGFKGGYNYYHSADLVFPDTPDWDKTDWSSFRREAAKDILAGWFAAKIGNPIIDYPQQSCKFAIQLADELIKALRNG